MLDQCGYQNSKWSLDSKHQRAFDFDGGLMQRSALILNASYGEGLYYPLGVEGEEVAFEGLTILLN